MKASESGSHDTSVQASMSLSGAAKLPPKKRALGRGKAVLDESEKNNLEIDLNSSELPPISLGIEEIAPTKLETTLLDQAPEKSMPDQDLQNADSESEKQQSIKLIKFDLDAKNEETGESSFNLQALSPPPPQSPPKKIYMCKFCCQAFSTSQALGGHQNAHRQEREMQRAMKAAQDDPFGHHMLNTRMAPLHVSHGSHHGHHSRYSPYQGYVAGRWPTRPIYPSPGMGLVQGSPSIGQALVHRQPTLNQGHIQSQPTLAQGLVRGQPNVGQGLFQVQPRIQGLVHGTPSHAQGLVHGQPRHGQGINHNHPRHGQEIIHNHPGHAQGVFHSQPSHDQTVIGGQHLMNPINTAYNPEWPTAYVSPSGLIRADGIPSRSTGLNLSLNTSQPADEDTELDLTLKL